MSWLSSLFSSAPPSGDPRVIDIVEQAIAVVDPRLRALPAYQARLLPAAQKAWEHVCSITRPMPAPVELQRERWSIDPLLRAVFATPDEIERLLSRSNETPASVAPGGRVCALLVTQRREYKHLGVEHNGDQTLHDVQQITVDFDEHRLVCPSASVPEMRQLIKRRALNQLYLRALDEIQHILASRQQLEQQRSVLQARLRMMQGQGGTLDELLRGGNGTQTPDLRQQLEANAAQLHDNHASLDTLDDYLQVLIHTLEHASDYLHATPIRLTLDTMNIIVDPASGKGNSVELTDVCFERAAPWRVCVAPVSYPLRQGSGSSGIVADAERYL